MIITIIVIIVIIAIIKALLGAAGEFIEKILFLLAACAAAIGIFYLIRFLLHLAINKLPGIFQKIGDFLHHMVCLIPTQVMVGYMMVALIAAVIYLCSIMYCVNFQMILNHELKMIPVKGNKSEIRDVLKQEMEAYSSGVTRFLAELRFKKESAWLSVINKNCVSLPSGSFCSRAVVEELSDVMAELYRATDKEIISQIRQNEMLHSCALYEISEQFEDLKKCLLFLKEQGELKIIENVSGIASAGLAVEGKLYESKKEVSINSENYLPTIHISID